MPEFPRVPGLKFGVITATIGRFTDGGDALGTIREQGRYRIIPEVDLGNLIAFPDSKLIFTSPFLSGVFKDGKIEAAVISNENSFAGKPITYRVEIEVIGDRPASWTLTGIDVPTFDGSNAVDLSAFLGVIDVPEPPVVVPPVVNPPGPVDPGPGPELPPVDPDKPPVVVPPVEPPPTLPPVVEPPVVPNLIAFSEPVNGATVKDTQRITCFTSGPGTFTSVDLYANGSKLVGLVQGPETARWSKAIDTKTLPNGKYASVQARGYIGGTSSFVVTESITVIIDNTSPVPPVVTPPPVVVPPPVVIVPPVTTPPINGPQRPTNALNLTGPRGFNYPLNIPWVGARAARDEEVACDLATMKLAAKSVSRDERRKGVVFRVRPGKLTTGEGTRSGAKSPLSGAGDPAWANDVDSFGNSIGYNGIVFVPRDGRGSVIVEGKSIMLTETTGIHMVGFVFNRTNWGANNTVNCGWHWCKTWTQNITGHNIGFQTYETTTGYFRSWYDAPEIDISDGVNIRPADKPDGTAGTITDFERVGCHGGPIYKLMNEAAHVDDLQFERASGSKAMYAGRVLLSHNIDYAAANQTLLLASSIDSITIRHSKAYDGHHGRKVFPLFRVNDTKKDHDFSQINQVKDVKVATLFQGGATNVDVFDSEFMGSPGGIGYRRVERTYRADAIKTAGAQPKIGQWLVKPEIRDYTLADLLRMNPAPTEQYLANVWKWQLV